MSTYRYDKWINNHGLEYYNIEKKTLFGWKEEKYWVVSRWYGSDIVRTDEEAKKEVMETIDRLIKAGHTVL